MKKQQVNMKVVIFSMLMSFVVAVAQASTYYVAMSGDDGADGSESTPFATFAKAVSCCGNGDCVVLGKGTHDVSAEATLDCEITVRGATGVPEDVILKMNGEHRHFTLNNANAKIESITLVDGHVNGNQLDGGSVYIDTNGGVVSNCVFNGCQAKGGWGQCGGAVAIYGANGLVTHCVITNCTITDTGNASYDRYGTGMGVFMTAGNLRNCLIAGNYVTTTSTTRNRGGAEPVKVIFDTDLYTDYDDVGAIAMLHTLADAGECEILAMGTCTWGKDNRSVAAVEVLNAYYGRADIPVGSTDHGGISGAGARGFGLAERYPAWVRHLDGQTAPKAVDVYRKALELAPDESVTMISVGFMNNIADLVHMHHDLVARKVKLWVCMACSYPDGKECNSQHDVSASDEAFRNWPTPIIWTDFQYGRTCYAGRVAAELPSGGDNPVRDVFRKMLTPREKVVKDKTWDQLAGHPSWDETAVLIAVRGWEPYFNLERGRFEMVGTAGDDRWVADPKSRSGRVTEKLSKVLVGAIIDELMTRPRVPVRP